MTSPDEYNPLVVAHLSKLDHSDARSAGLPLLKP